ncbi:MAG: hypothetical protein JO232_23065 [Verrucomicrobia bacterium]|nr:hypothetical protein [Verrucomicrobiota bacterium]
MTLPPNNRLRSRLRFSVALLLLAWIEPASAPAEDINDPIAGYLSINVPDRTENTGGLLILKKVEVDIDGDGTPETFVGTWYRKSGPNTWLWAGYQKESNGYRRITPADSDILIDFANIYVGEIPELQRQGLVQGYSLELDNKDRDQSNMLSDLEYYYIDNGTLVQQSAGLLDRDDPSQKETYDFFFGPNRKIRETPKVESFTIIDLIHRGYRMPDWAKPR